MGDRLNDDTPTSPEEDQQQLSDKQLVAIGMLSQGMALRAVARRLEIDLKTLYRWRHEPAFESILAQRRAEIWSDTVDRLRGMCDDCLDELHAQLHDRYDRARFRAATALLKMVNIKKATAELEPARRRK